MNVYIWDLDDCKVECTEHDDFAKDGECDRCPCYHCFMDDWEVGNKLCKRCPQDWKLGDCAGSACDEADAYGDGDHSDEGGVPVPSDAVYCSEDFSAASDVYAEAVQWQYTVETTTTTPDELEEVVCAEMGETIIDRIKEEHCTKRRLLGGRRLEIQGFNEVTCKKMPISSCPLSMEKSKSCSTYTGEVTVVYDSSTGDNSSGDEVTDTVTDIAEDVVTSDTLIATVNENVDDAGDNEYVTHIGWGTDKGKAPAAGLSGELFVDESKNGLTKAGKWAVGLMALLLLLIILLFYLWRRQARQERQQAWANKSVATDESSGGSPARKGAGGGDGGDDDKSYMTSDFNNLGLHHSKLNVHRCTSGMCEKCNPPDNDEPPGVFFIRSRGGAPLDSIIEEDGSSSVKASDENSPPTFFSRFLRSPPSSPRSDRVIREGGAQGSDDSEIEI